MVQRWSPARLSSEKPRQGTTLVIGIAAGLLISGAVVWGITPQIEGAPISLRAVPGALHAATDARLWSWAVSRTRRPFVPGSGFSRNGDFVAAYYTMPARHPLIKGGRAWRKEYGVRTVVVSQVSAEEAGITPGEQEEWDEVWQSWPDIDDQNGTLDVGSISFSPGDHRGAMTPLIAHRELGDNYKWMLYGDDDTVFFPEGVARAVEGLDPDMPYFLADRMWGFGFGDGQQFGATPRCVPCGWDNPRGLDTSRAPVPPLQGCPCDRVQLCEHWKKHVPELWPPDCTADALHMIVPWHLTFHGGGGAIFSVGLLRRLGWDRWRECIDTMRLRQGSDAYVTKCIWHADFGITDPGYSYFTEDPLRYFTFDRWTFMGRKPLSMITIMQRKMMEWNETAGFCQAGDSSATGCIVPDVEDELFVTMVSVHAMASASATFEAAGEAVALASRVYREYVDTIAQAHPQVMKLDISIGAGSVTK